MKPPGVEDCPSPMSHESYQDVVVSGVVGIVVVGGNVVVVVIALNLINLSCRRRRRRAILSLLCLSALTREFGEYPLLPSTTRLLPLGTAGCCTLLLVLL